MAAQQTESVFIQAWIKRVMQSIYRTYGDGISDKKVMSYLHTILENDLYNPDVALVNNYVDKMCRTDLLATIDQVTTNKHIIGGDGVLYIQHDIKDNVLCGFILQEMDIRDIKKAERKQYDETSYEWLACDIEQLNTKIIINTLYGVLGYIKFILSNRFIAQSVTNQGKQIICTAVCAFENFMGDNVKISTFSELYEYMNNICDEYVTHYMGKLDMSFLQFDHNADPVVMVKNRLKCKLGFKMDTSEENILEEFLSRRSIEELLLLYYKNNLIEFSKLPFIVDKFKYLIDSIDSMVVPDITKLTHQQQEIIKAIEDFYRVFVIYDYPIYDRLRKSMYTDKKSVLYVDTDSNFLSCASFIRYLKDDVMHNQFNKSKSDIESIMVNIISYFCHTVVNDALYGLSLSMNVKEEYAHYLYMKNEFYMDRIVFTDKKKRYFANQVIQEGKVLNHGKGKIDIKGFDFKKSTTKPFVRDFFTSICEDYILRADKIDLTLIYKKTKEMSADIRNSVRNGESKYFKQSNVKLLEQYKLPYSQQQTTSVILWNILVPDYQIELPGDVDIVPIKELGAIKKRDRVTGEDTFDFSRNKNVDMLRDKYPETYKRFEDGIMNSTNPKLRTMSMKYIAKPKNSEIPLPEWYFDLVDIDKIENDNMALFLPIMEILGFKPQRINAKKTLVSNMIDL